MSHGDTGKTKSIMGLVIAGFLIMGKSTKIVAALKLLKFGKPLVTVISMAISAVAYGIYLGPWFGVGLVAMLFVHEMGHIVALRIKGIQTHGPVFMPFLGAAIFSPKFGDRDTEAFVGYGGPLLGTIAALVCFGAWYYTGKTSEILLLVSYTGMFLNIFNLIPISPLDGGRITQAVGWWFKYVGLAILLVYTFMAMQPGLFLIWVLVLDSFDRMPLWFRPAIGSLIGIGMLAFMVFGFSEQPLWLDIFDCIIVIGFNYLYVRKDSRRSKGSYLLEEVDDRIDLPNSTRAKWLGYYLVLSIFAATVISVQVEYLPNKVKDEAEKMTTEPANPPILVQ